MTDLLSSLADSIVALINAKPQSPTKAEVEEVLRGSLTPETTAAAVPSKMAARWLQELELHNAYAAKDRDLREVHEKRMAAIFNEPFDNAIGGACPGSADGSHAWTYQILYDESRCPCGAVTTGYDIALSRAFQP